MGDEDEDLFQLLQFSFVSDAISLIPAEPACSVDQENIESVQTSIFQELLELGPVS